MRKSYVGMALIAGALIWLPTAALSQDGSSGRIEYEANCAVCHGETGTGAGPFADYIKTAVPDLTMLAKNNGGVFPAERVHEVIDGRREVATHGPRNMPIWGREYNDQAVEYYREVWKIQHPESIVSDRINGLVAYIESLQEQ
jgi:mono/diheme cytochrome c family protein